MPALHLRVLDGPLQVAARRHLPPPAATCRHLPPPAATCRLPPRHRRVYSTPVYLALLMVVSGVALVSCRDVNFSSFSLMAGMISNAAFALYSIYAKRAMQAHPEVLTPRTAYALLTMGSLTMLTPLALLMEWSGAGSSRLASASTAVGTLRTGWRLAALLGFTGLVQYVSNEIAFCTLSMIHPVTYAVANTLKRSIVVASSLVSQPTAPTGVRGGEEEGSPPRLIVRCEPYPFLTRAPSLWHPGVLPAESTRHWICRSLYGDRRRLHVLRVLGRSVIAGSPSRYLSPSRLSCVPLWSICCGVSAVETLRRLQVCIREKKALFARTALFARATPDPVSV